MEKKAVMGAQPETVPAAEELETLCAAVQPAVARAREELEDRYFERLAEEALGPKWADGVPGEEAQRLLAGVQGELDRLQQASRSLAHSYQAVVELEDELGARVRDVRKSRDRKWYAPNPPANAGIDLAEKRLNHFAQGLNIYKILLVFWKSSSSVFLLAMSLSTSSRCSSMSPTHSSIASMNFSTVTRSTVIMFAGGVCFCPSAGFCVSGRGGAIVSSAMFLS